MVCIYCNSKTSIINSRNQVKPNNKWRRRQCSKCSSTVTTIETVDYSKAIVVIDRKNKTKDFIRDKLFLSVYAACKHRKNSITCADALTETIIIKIINNLDDASIHTDTIQNLVKTVLKDFDNSAYVQYLAYHN